MLLWGNAYTGTIHDQECVSCCHPGMCVQGGIGTNTVAQRSSCTHWAELLWLLNWRDQDVFFYILKTWNYFTAGLTLTIEEKNSNNHINTCGNLCIGSYLYDVHLYQWHHKVLSRESPAAESLEENRHTNFTNGRRLILTLLSLRYKEIKLWS